MIIITFGCGGLCNQICTMVHGLATAIDTRDNIVNLVGPDILKFSAATNPPFAPVKAKIVGLHPTRIQSYLELKTTSCKRLSAKYSDGNNRRIKRWHETRWMPKLIWNWFFRNPTAVAKHREQIVGYLQARPEFQRHPEDIIRKARIANKASIVVGVHIRRGDYRDFQNGELFFDDSTYAQFMLQFSRSCQHDKVTFIIVSNEHIDPSYFLGQGIDVIVASASPYEDIVTLSKCDYIMGPRSTFSWWASYYGNVPRLAISSANDHVAKNLFRKPAET